MYKMTMLLGLLVAIMSVSASGVGFIGAPTAGLEQGQWSVGYNYMYSNMGLERTTQTGAWAEFDANGDLDKAESDDYHLEKINIDDVKTQRHYGTIGYGLSNSWEAYVQLGIADVKAKTRDTHYDPLDDEDDGGYDWQWDGHNFDNDFAWGLGTRITFHEQGNCRWGASVQMNWVDTSYDVTSAWEENGADITRKDEFDYSTYDLIIAVGPTVDMGDWNLYGGTFYYMLEGEFDVDVTVAWENGSTGSAIGEGSADLESHNIGVFVGAQCTLMGKASLTTEFSFTEDGWACGTGVGIPF